MSREKIKRLVLAIDTSQTLSSIALIKDDELVSGKIGQARASHSESIMPLIDGLLVCNDVKIQDIDCFAVGVGPGSFTGIRIGMATIKTLAQVLQKKIIPFSSLEALYFSAYQKPESGYFSMSNAYQALVFAGFYDGEKFNELALPPDDFVRQLVSKKEKEHHYCGSGARLYETVIRNLCAANSVQSFFSPIENVTPEGIFKAVQRRQSAVEVNDIAANYLRPSQAEINLANLNKL